MSLRRLLGLSAAAAAPVRLRRSLATAATHPSWAIFKRLTSGDGPGSGATLRLAGPPHLSYLTAPRHLVKASPSPDPGTGLLQFIPGSVRAASSDGLLLLSCSELLLKIPIFARPGKEPAEFDPDHVPDFTRFVCNPVTAELSRLPDVASGPVRKVMCSEHMGLLTRANSGRDGPPDRFAVAELQGNVMVRFLSETGEWETVAVSPSPCQPRRMVLDQHVVAFGGRLWWLDVTCGAISADPFSDRPELCFVELPRGSALPAAEQGGCCRCGGPYGCGISRHRRLCVSEERLRYLEVSQEEPFVLSSFSLDDEGGSWTLERRLDLSRCRWLPLPLKEGNSTLQIGFADPFNANWVYMSACNSPPTPGNAPQLGVFVVDMNEEDVIVSSSYRSGDASIVPCVLPPWLGSSRIPAAGKKGVKKNKTLADVLVRADNP